MRIRKWLRNQAPQWDYFDWVALLCLGFVGAANWVILVIQTFSFSAPSPSQSLAILTAGSVFYGQYRLRHPNKSQMPAVRPTYKELDGTDTGYGLKNYGAGVALYLQIRVTGEDYEIDILEPNENPTHLEEGKFFDFIQDASEEKAQEFISLLESVDADSEICFYYSYIAPSGVREPLSAKQLTQEDDAEILSELQNSSNNPRSIQAEYLKRHLDIK